MLALRSLFAGLMLAVVAFGGVGTPLVHEALHAADREVAQALHASDGNHTRPSDGLSRVSEECPAPPLSLGLDCVLCHGLTAALVASAAATLPDATADVYGSTAPPLRATQHVAAPSGRGPPAV